MRLGEQAKYITSQLTPALLAFVRGLLDVVAATRLVHGLVYVTAAVFTLIPVVVVGDVLNWGLAKESIWVGGIMVGVAAILLLLFAALMTNEQFLRDTLLKGTEWPSLFSVALAWLAVVVFGGLSCVCERVGLVHIAPHVPFSDGCATRYADMYLWHLFDSIPGIKFNETIGWTQHYTYSDKLSGWLLLAFKVLVIVSVIGSFVVFGRLRRDAVCLLRVPKQAESTDA